MEAEQLSEEQIEAIARVCHEANRAYCATIGDNSQLPWDEAPAWQRESAVAGVKTAIEKRYASAAGMHAAWCAHKIADGWVYGEVKDAERKTHPCLVPFSQLPVEQRRKDELFRKIVWALA